MADTTGRSTLAFARAKLFGPLGIHTEHAFQPVGVAFPTPAEERAYERAKVAWVTDPQGYHSDFAGLQLPARDLAHGLGGQFVQVIPHLDLVVVITSDADNGRDDAQQLVGEAIIPASTG